MICLLMRKLLKYVVCIGVTISSTDTTLQQEREKIEMNYAISLNSGDPDCFEEYVFV